MEAVWTIISDYNNLASHVPNLVQSYLVKSPNNKLRLYQEGAQKIIGFDFRAALTMEMDEEPEDKNLALKDRNLSFKLIESQMFSAFDGNWNLKYHSRSKVVDPVTNREVVSYKTKLSYSVYVKPKGIVPVIALEWRIKEDVPVNLIAVKIAAEKLYNERLRMGFYNEDGTIAGNSNNGSSGSSAGGSNVQKKMEWLSDETLGSYIPNSDSTSTNSKSSINNYWVPAVKPDYYSKRINWMASALTVTGNGVTQSWL